MPAYVFVKMVDQNFNKTVIQKKFHLAFYVATITQDFQLHLPTIISDMQAWNDLLCPCKAKGQPWHCLTTSVSVDGFGKIGWLWLVSCFSLSSCPVYSCQNIKESKLRTTSALAFSLFDCTYSRVSHWNQDWDQFV